MLDRRRWLTYLLRFGRRRRCRLRRGPREALLRARDGRPAVLIEQESLLHHVVALACQREGDTQLKYNFIAKLTTNFS